MASDPDIFTLTPLSKEDKAKIQQAALATQDLDVFAILRDDATRNVDVYKTLAHHADLVERDLYDDYRTEYLENPLVSLLVNHVVGELMRFHLEGEPEEVAKVQLAWDNLDVEAQLTIVARQAVLLGNGFGDKLKKSKQIVGFRDIDASTVEIDRDPEKGTETFKQQGEELKRENLLVFRPVEYPDTPYGISLLRSSIKSLQGLGNLGDDIPAAIKRLAYAEKVLKLNLEDLDDPAKKSEALKKAKEKMAKYDSATAQVTAMDAKHDLKYVGSEGGGIQRIIPLMGVIEPLLAFVLTNHYLALGHVMQTGANKALLEMQEKRARQALEPLKRKFARVLERELIADVLGIEIDWKGKKPLTELLPVRVVHDRHPEEVLQDRKLLLQEWTAGLLPREYVVLRAGHVVPDEYATGGTYYYDTPLGQKSATGPKENAPQAQDKDAGASHNGKGGSQEKKAPAGEADA